MGSLPCFPFYFKHNLLVQGTSTAFATIIILLPSSHTSAPRYEDRQKELEAVVKPIFTKLYGGAGGGMPEGFEGGMPGAGGAPGGGGSAGGYGGPTVEEVD